MVYGHVFPSSLLGKHCPLANVAIHGEKFAVWEAMEHYNAFIFILYYAYVSLVILTNE